MESYTNNEKNAVPSLAQFCMVCLNINMECKLYPVNKYNLDLEFEKLTGISLQGKMPFEPHICAECTQRLRNCSRFRSKSLRAHQILMGLANHEVLTTQNIKTIDRKTNRLESNIAKKVFQPDHCDLHLIDLKDNYDTEKNFAEVKKEKFIFEDTNTVLNVKCEVDLFNVEISKDKTNNKLQSTVNELKNDTDVLDYDIDTDDCDDTDHDTLVIDQRNVKEEGKNDKQIINDVRRNNYDITTDDCDDTDHDTLAIDQRNVKEEGKNNKQIINDVRRNKTKGNEVKQMRNQIKSETQIKKNVINEVRTHDSVVKKKKESHTGLKRGRRKVNFKLFQEIELTQEQQVAEILNRKKSNNYKNAPHKCSVCFKGYHHVEAYNAHMDRHTDKFGLFECDICRMRFKSKFTLRKHVPNHKFIYKCTKCQFESNHRTAVVHHKRWHDGKTYKCPHCGEQFTKCTSYMSHVRIKHPSDSVCAQCGFSFIGERGLRMHMAKKHNLVDGTQNLSGPSCETCKIRFASQEAYKQHVEASPKHAPADQLKPNCPLQKKMSRNTVMSTCELCGMQLKSARQYTVHFKTKHPDQKPTQFPQAREMCEKCGKVFTSPVFLLEHMQVHTGKKLYKCDVCGKGFMTKGALKYHIDRHSDNLACSVCSKPFSNQANLTRHMVSHLSVRPSFKCEYCGKSYTSIPGRDQHVSHVHHHVPWPRKVNGRRHRVNARRLSVHSD